VSRSTAEVIGILLAAGAPRRLMLRAPWPIHQALKEMAEQAATCGMDHLLPDGLVFAPDPDVGLAAVGVGVGLHELAINGVLCFAGETWEARLQVRPEALRPYLKLLMKLDPMEAAFMHQVAETWIARSRIAEKNWVSVRESLARIRKSATQRRQAAVGATR
jgi:hypothetical protein